MLAVEVVATPPPRSLGIIGVPEFAVTGGAPLPEGLQVELAFSPETTVVAPAAVGEEDADNAGASGGKETPHTYTQRYTAHYEQQHYYEPLELWQGTIVAWTPATAT